MSAFSISPMQDHSCMKALLAGSLSWAAKCAYPQPERDVTKCTEGTQLFSRCFCNRQALHSVEPKRTFGRLSSSSMGRPAASEVE